MWLKLRQIALVTEKLAPTQQALEDVLGIAVCFNDPGVGHFGLENALFPIGNTMLEVVAPIRENTAGGRYLERRHGDGGYMVITQCDDHLPRRARVEKLGVRIVNQFETHEFRNLQMHPRDTGGSFFEIDEQLGAHAHDDDGPWEPAGPDWKKGQRLDRVKGVSAAEMQCDDPKATAARWSEIAEIPVTTVAGVATLKLKNADLRFVPITDGRPEGLSALDIQTSNKAAILNAAEARGLVKGPDLIYLCGMRMYLK